MSSSGNSGVISATTTGSSRSTATNSNSSEVGGASLPVANLDLSRLSRWAAVLRKSGKLPVALHEM